MTQRPQSPHALPAGARAGFTPEPPSRSLALIRACDLHPDDPILHVGGDDPRLIEALLAEGFRDITVIDASSAALEAVRARLGERGDRVRLLRADLLHLHPHRRFALWHDATLFRRLEHPEEQQQYIEVAQQALRPEGHLILVELVELGSHRAELGTHSGLGRQFECLDSEPALEGAASGAAVGLRHSRFRRHAPPRLSA